VPWPVRSPVVLRRRARARARLRPRKKPGSERHCDWHGSVSLRCCGRRCAQHICTSTPSRGGLCRESARGDAGVGGGVRQSSPGTGAAFVWLAAFVTQHDSRSPRARGQRASTPPCLVRVQALGAAGAPVFEDGKSLASNLLRLSHESPVSAADAAHEPRIRHV
jgi:hypothetical protein